MAAIEAATAGAGGFALARASRDAAMLLALPVGNHTATVQGLNEATGSALSEVYGVP